MILKEFATAKLFDGGAYERGAGEPDSSRLDREFRGDLPVGVEAGSMAGRRGVRLERVRGQRKKRIPCCARNDNSQALPPIEEGSTAGWRRVVGLVGHAGRAEAWRLHLREEALKRSGAAWERVGG